MDTSTSDSNCEMIAGRFDRKGIMEELVLNGIVIVKAEERIFAKEIRETEEVEVECVIADDESVIGEGAQEHGLLARHDAESFLDSLDTCDQMRIGTCATDTREELRNRSNRLSFHGVRIETLEFLDGEFHFFDRAVFDKHVHASRTFDFGELFDAELTEFGYLMHRMERIGDGERRRIWRKFTGCARGLIRDFLLLLE